MKTQILLVATLALSACSSEAPPANESAPSPAVSSEAAVVDCANLPEHVTLPEDAKISLCTRGKTSDTRESGTIIFTTAMAAPAVLAWYRDRAKAMSFRDGLVTPASYSIIPDQGRTLMAMTAAAPNGTQVTLNWGHTR